MNNGATAPWLVAIAYTDLPSDARVIRAAREARRRGFRVTMLVPRASEGKEAFRLDGIDIEWLDVEQQRGRTTLGGQVRFMRAVSRWARNVERRPDVVHVHNMPDYLYYAVRRWHKRGARVLIDVHDVMSDLALHRFKGRAQRRLASFVLGSLEKRVWKTVDRVITVHEAYRDIIVSAGIPPEKVSIVLNVPDPDVCRPELRVEPARGAFKIVFHGTVSSRTGVLNAVQAMPQVIKEVPNATMVIIGGGNGVADVHVAIRSLDLESRVRFLDRFFPMERVLEEICDAHAAVVPNEPSVFTRGILPVKLLEYATLQIPVVATSLPLIERYFGDHAVHLISDPTPPRIAEGLIRIAKEPEYRDQLIAASQEFAMRHGWHRYREVLGAALTNTTVATAAPVTAAVPHRE